MWFLSSKCIQTRLRPGLCAEPFCGSKLTTLPQSPSWTMEGLFTTRGMESNRPLETSGEGPGTTITLLVCCVRLTELSFTCRHRTHSTRASWFLVASVQQIYVQSIIQWTVWRWIMRIPIFITKPSFSNVLSSWVLRCGLLQSVLQRALL